MIGLESPDQDALTVLYFHEIFLQLNYSCQSVAELNATVLRFGLTR